MYFIEQRGTYCPPKHRGNGIYKSELNFSRGQKTKALLNGINEFDGHYIWLEEHNKKFVKLLGSEIKDRNPLPSRVYWWDFETKSLSPMPDNPDRVTWIEPGQGIFAFPDKFSRNFLLWTLTLA